MVDERKDAMLMAGFQGMLAALVGSTEKAGGGLQAGIDVNAAARPDPDVAPAAPTVQQILDLAYAAGVAAGNAQPESAVCGRGDVMRPGHTDWVHDPLLRSPFGQDYHRHTAFVRAAMNVLAAHHVAATARLVLD